MLVAEGSLVHGVYRCFSAVFVAVGSDAPDKFFALVLGSQCLAAFSYQKHVAAGSRAHPKQNKLYRIIMYERMMG